MNEENAKIAKIKKSCRIGKKVSGILFVIAVIGAIACFISGIFILASGKKFDDSVKEAEAAGYISTTDEFGSAKSFNINLGSLPKNIHSDIPAWQDAIEDHPLSFSYGMYVLVMGVGVAIVAVTIMLIKSVFATIEKEETPFTAKVKKKVTIVLIITSGIVMCTVGAGFAVLGVLITWAVNAILDYGITLQTQSDETL